MAASSSSSSAIIRLSKELRQTIDHPDSGIYCNWKEEDVTRVHALIVGPDSTPYDGGLFEFKLTFGKDYPQKPPTVIMLTTNGGQTRFNPNLYSNGKVCLSILGTWYGQPGTSAHGLSSVLLSIQSLMGGTPYENEPGFEKSSSRSRLLATDTDEAAMRYSQKIMHETIRITICDRLESLLGMKSSPFARKITASGRNMENALPSPSDMPLPGNVVTENVGLESMDDVLSNSGIITREQQIPTKRLDLHLPSSSRANTPDIFQDLVKQLFLAYYSRYITIVRREGASVKKGMVFYHASFEGGGNEMPGYYDYPSLEKRLNAIREALENESKQWTIQGKEQVLQETSIASRLEIMFIQTSAEFKQMTNVSFALGDDESNPFLWVVTYIGQRGSSYEGGIWNIEIRFSPNYPAEQARVKFRTPFYHVNVARDGIIWQARHSQENENIKCLIQLIIDVFECPIQTDPAMRLNLEAAALAFGNDAQKRDYNRSVRRMGNHWGAS